MRKVPLAKVNELLATARRASDMAPDQLTFLADVFQEAHERTVGGLSIEVGTRKGGSAWLMLSMLREMYDDATRPMLLTVDPYGDKPYLGGDEVAPGGAGVGLYGPHVYRAARHWLAEFPEHAHYYMTSETFFQRLLGSEYHLRGEAREIDDLAFVLLDGDHTAEAIVTELGWTMAHMQPGGIILIDNADKDLKTDGSVREEVERFASFGDEVWSVTSGPPAPAGAAQLVVRFQR